MMRISLRKIVTCLALSAVISAPVMGQQQNPQTDPNVTVHPLQEVPLGTTVNFMEIEDDWWPNMRNTTVVHQPGVNVEKDAFIQHKAEIRAEREAMMASGELYGDSPQAQQRASAAATPTLGNNFYANPYDGGIPNDNGIAVSDGGKVVSVANSSIRMYLASGPLIRQNSLQGFSSGLGGAQQKYDPKVVYHNGRDRFVVVYLSGSTAATSKVIVGFAETSDPAGNWHMYALDGNVTSGTWTDFPQIALSEDELFITGNLFTDAGFSSGSVVWQIELEDGFLGNSLTTQTYTSGTYFSLHPVQGGTELYGPNMYILRNTSNPFGTSTNLWVHEVTNTIANGGTLASPALLSLNQSYGSPPNVDQQGTSTLLNTNECRVQSSYYQNGRIEYAHNTIASGQCGVYHGTVELSPLGPSFSSATGRVIRIDSFDIAYPGIAYGGCRSDITGQNASLIMFNFASPNHFPGNGCVYLGTDATLSAPLICKYGFTYMSMGSSPTRWGDYADAAERTNNPGEFWIGGSIGISSNDNATWISQVFTECNTGTVAVENAAEEEVRVTAFPNPAVELIHIEFDVPETGVYRVSVHDLNGREIKLLVEDKVKQGVARLRMNTANLSNGMYMIRIAHEGELVHTEKVVVQH